MQQIQSPTNLKCFELWRMFLTEKEKTPSRVYIYRYRNCQKEQRTTDLHNLQFSLSRLIFFPSFSCFHNEIWFSSWYFCTIYEFLWKSYVNVNVFFINFSSYVNFGFTFSVSIHFLYIFSAAKQSPPTSKFKSMSIVASRFIALIFRRISRRLLVKFN